MTSQGDGALSEVLGVIMVLVTVLILLSLYQVYGIPNENSEIEFKHSQDARGDMLDVRNAVVDAWSTGRTTSASVRLAPQYPTRLVGINPSAPTAALETTEPSPISIRDGGGDVVDLCPVTDDTRMVEYEAAYNEYRENPTIRVENTVVYADYPNTTRPVSGQRLVEGDEVNLLVVQPEYQKVGSGDASVDPRAGRLEVESVDDPTVTVPTELDEDGWTELLEGEVAPADVSVAGGNLTLDLSGTRRLSCGVVSLDGEPLGGDRPFDPGTADPVEGDAAYTTYWLDDDLVVDGQETQDLTVGTQPTADSAEVRYAVNDSSVATVPSNGTTAADGTDTVTVSAESEGTVAVYAWSGGSGDTVNVTFQNLAPAFNTLTAEVNVQENQDRIRSATFTYDIDTVETVTFSVVGLGSETVTGSGGTVQVSPGGQEPLPVTLRGEIQGGQCLEITVPSGTADGAVFDLVADGTEC